MSVDVIYLPLPDTNYTMAKNIHTAILILIFFQPAFGQLRKMPAYPLISCSSA